MYYISGQLSVILNGKETTGDSDNNVVAECEVIHEM